MALNPPLFSTTHTTLTNKIQNQSKKSSKGLWRRASNDRKHGQVRRTKSEAHHSDHKDRPWLEETRKAMMDRGAKQIAETVHEDLNSDLLILYAEDSPKNIRYFSPKDLEKARIDRKELRSLACENLKRLLPKIERSGANGLFMLTAGGDYEASLLLFDSIWSNMKKEVRGDVVVAIPSRDLLIVTGSEDSQGIEKMKQIVQKASAEGSYRLTTKLFVFHGTKLDEFKQ